MLRANQVLKTLSPLDVGQGVVVENGLVLGIETLQGQMRYCHLWQQRRQICAAPSVAYS